MPAEFISVETDDGALHQGLLFAPRENTRKGIIHVHGLAGNFYENKFIPEMAEKYTEKGFLFLCLNNRGHDYMADIETSGKAGRTSFMGGGAYEKFTDSPNDIRAAVKFLENKGADRICLQGHSTGCNKIVYGYPGIDSSSVCRVALLSPCDDIALMQKELGNKFKEGLKLAEKAVREGKGEELLPADNVFYPMSARVYLDYYTPGSAHDIFRYRNPASEFPGLRGLKMPVFAVYGTEGEFLQISPEEAFEILRKKLRSPRDLTAGTISGADHNYRGREDKLARGIAAWLKKTRF